jgi:trans-aconitate 2-methyltransferase
MIDWNAREYNRQSRLQEGIARERLAGLALNGNERVLDIGCGDGKVTALIAARVPRGTVLGIDASPDMIDFATAAFSAADHPNLRFELADAARLSFRAQFDLIVSFNVLHWVHDQAAALRGIAASLAFGGQAHLQFVPESDRPSIEGIFEITRHTPRWRGHFRGFRRPHAHFTADEYCGLAEANGLRVLHIAAEDRSYDFATRAEFAGFCGATFGAWVCRLPEAHRPAFVDAALDRYRAACCGGPGEEHRFRTFQMQVNLERA